MSATGKPMVDVIARVDENGRPFVDLVLPLPEQPGKAMQFPLNPVDAQALRVALEHTLTTLVAMLATHELSRRSGADLAQAGQVADQAGAMFSGLFGRLLYRQDAELGKATGQSLSTRPTVGGKQ